MASLPDGKTIEMIKGKMELHSKDIFYPVKKDEMVQILIEHGINIESKDDANTLWFTKSLNWFLKKAWYTSYSSDTTPYCMPKKKAEYR